MFKEKFSVVPMRKVFWIFPLLALLCGSCAVKKSLPVGTVSTIQIRDDNFRAFLLEKGYVTLLSKSPEKGKNKVSDKWVKVTEKGLNETVINCHARKIKSLEGLELFPKLEVLICSENPITHLDLHNAPNLTTLVAIETPLRQLELSGNPNLQVLQISFHHLRHLDLSHNPKLRELYSIFADKQTELDLSHNPDLQTLYIRESPVGLVDLRRNTSFRSLFAYDAPLQYIVVSPQQNLDSVVAVVEDDVQLLVLDTNEALPKIRRTSYLSRLAARSNEVMRRPSHNQYVMTHARAAESGINEDSLLSVYLPAFEIDTLTGGFTKNSMIQSQNQMVGFVLSWRQFLSDIGAEMLEQHFDWDKIYDGHCVVYFSADGTVDYFLYNYIGEKPPESTQRAFEQVLERYVAKNKIGYFGSRKFKQCGGVRFAPSGVVEEDDE